MKLKLFGIAIATIAIGFVALPGSQPAFAACKDDISVVQQMVDQEQDATKKQKAAEELKEAQKLADSGDELHCTDHVKAAREHVKK
jgi:hypothetical protein